MAQTGFNPNILAQAFMGGLADYENQKQRQINDDFRRAQFLALTGATPESVLMGRKIADEIEGSSGPMAARIATEQKLTEPSIDFQAPLQRQAMPEKPETIETGNAIALPVGGNEMAPDVVSNIQKGLEQYSDLPAITKGQGRERAISELSPEAKGSLADYERVSGMADRRSNLQSERLAQGAERLALQKNQFSARNKQNEIENSFRTEKLKLDSLAKSKLTPAQAENLALAYKRLAVSAGTAVENARKAYTLGGYEQGEVNELSSGLSSIYAGINKSISDFNSRHRTPDMIKNDYQNGIIDKETALKELKKLGFE